MRTILSTVLLAGCGGLTPPTLPPACDAATCPSEATGTGTGANGSGTPTGTTMTTDSGDSCGPDGTIACEDPQCASVCDADGDGFFRQDWGYDDCDDGDSSINPGAAEVCEDGIDQDCSGADASCLPDCVRLGFKFGADATWACPAGYRMPTTLEYNRVQACFLPTDLTYFDYYHDVATAVGGCDCKWNAAWCDQPSIETILGGRMCGDFDQLHVCVSLP